jgi:hypothetical protein
MSDLAIAQPSKFSNHPQSQIHPAKTQIRDSRKFKKKDEAVTRTINLGKLL